MTLVELVLVVAIIGILAAIAVPSYLGYSEKAQLRGVVADIRHIETTLTEFYYEYKCYPASLAVVGQDTLLDPWGNPYQYLPILCGAPPGSGGKVRKDKNLHPLNSTFDLCSMGPDGKTVAPLTAQDSRDDIIRANDGRYVGPAADY
jgi:general secretion pathway protein G